MKKSVRLLITFGIIVVGLLIAAYPFISNYLYEHKQEEVISAYDEQIKGEKEDVLKKEWELAEEYNKELLKEKKEPDGWKKLIEHEKIEYEMHLKFANILTESD